MEYLGEFKVGKRKYIATKDNTNNLYNIFYKNTKGKDVECFSFPAIIVDSENGKTELDKIEYHWNRMLSCPPEIWEEEGIFPNEQVFPIGFWNDIIVKLKKGNLKGVEFKFIEQ